ncbi:MAG: hypothetical protein M1812_001189 [Candelaria pacifica]|nr:MAG: hypothetical protein M1812_001189 [Candelaria pacifica]
MPGSYVCDESYGLMDHDNCQRAVQEMPGSNRPNVFGNWDVPGIQPSYHLPQWFVHGDCVVAIYVNLYPDDIEGELEPGADTDIASWGEVQGGLLSLINRCSIVPAVDGGFLTKGGYAIGGVSYRLLYYVFKAPLASWNDPAPGSTIQWSKQGCRRVSEDDSAVACPTMIPPMGLQEPTSQAACGPSYYCTTDANCCEGASCEMRHTNNAAILLGVVGTFANFALGSCSPSSLSPRDIRQSRRDALSASALREGNSDEVSKISDRSSQKLPADPKRQERASSTVSAPFPKRRSVRRDDWAECLPEFGTPSAAACQDALDKMPSTLIYQSFGQWFTNANEALPQTWLGIHDWDECLITLETVSNRPDLAQWSTLRAAARTTIHQCVEGLQQGGQVYQGVRNEELVISVYTRESRMEVKETLRDCDFVKVGGPGSVESVEDACHAEETLHDPPSVVCQLEGDCGEGYTCVQRHLELPEVIYGFSSKVISAFSTCILAVGLSRRGLE